MFPFEVILSDGLTVWVNHPTVTHKAKMNYSTRVGRKVKLVTEAAFKEVISFTSVFKQGSNSTTIKVGMERLRKLLTDSRLSAKLIVEAKVYHLQIQSYKGRGNVYFTISSLGPFSDSNASGMGGGMEKKNCSGDVEHEEREDKLHDPKSKSTRLTISTRTLRDTDNLRQESVHLKTAFASGKIKTPESFCCG